MKKHFSLADWEFNPDTGFQLSTYAYVSPPTSLQMGGAGKPEVPLYCLLSNDLAHNVPQGKLITWLRGWGNMIYYLDNVFRVQAPPTNRQPDNCYLINQQENGWGLFKYLDGVKNTLASGWLDHPWQWHVWRKYRITWEEYDAGGGTAGLRITLDHLIDDTWEQVFTYDDPDNNWSDSSVNRVGFTGRVMAIVSAPVIDDTEIWQKA